MLNKGCGGKCTILGSKCNGVEIQSIRKPKYSSSGTSKLYLNTKLNCKYVSGIQGKPWVKQFKCKFSWRPETEQLSQM